MSPRTTSAILDGAMLCERVLTPTDLGVADYRRMTVLVNCEHDVEILYTTTLN